MQQTVEAYRVVILAVTKIRNRPEVLACQKESAIISLTGLIKY
jgi:hypothetical protein